MQFVCLFFFFQAQILWMVISMFCLRYKYKYKFMKLIINDTSL